jgi:hypothetical protein
MRALRQNSKRLALASLLLAAVLPCHAQTLTIALSASAVNFNLVRASANNLGNTSVDVTTSWVIGAQNRTLTVYCYFANSAAALTGGGVNIPSSAFSISTNGTAFRPLIISEPFGGANAGRRIIADIPITGTNHRTDNVVFNIDLSTGTLPQLPPGTYTGTLTIRAQAI